MPMKKENRSRYPINWPSISHRIRFLRAKGRCECLGECGRPHDNFHMKGKEGTLDQRTERCTAVHGREAPFTGSLVVLTVAHLNHRPHDCRDENLAAFCQRCHLAYDAEHHKANAAATRAKWSEIPNPLGGRLVSPVTDEYKRQ